MSRTVTLQEHAFTMVLDIPPIPSEIDDAEWRERMCTQTNRIARLTSEFHDVEFFTRRERHYFAFNREAASLSDAISSAARDLKQLGLNILQMIPGNYPHIPSVCDDEAMYQAIHWGEVENTYGLRFITRPYKGYIGGVRFDHGMQTCHGKMVNVRRTLGCLGLEPTKNITRDEAERLFRESVDSHMAQYREYGINPLMPSECFFNWKGEAIQWFGERRKSRVLT